MRSPLALLADDRAVSPVVGVVLMVGIVVVLSSVVGTLVFGVASTTPEKPPDAGANFEWDPGADGTYSGFDGAGSPCSNIDDVDSVEMTFVTLDRTLSINNVDIRVGGATESKGCLGSTDLGSKISGNPTKLRAGNTVTLIEKNSADPIAPGETLRVAWNDPDSGKTYVLAESEVPPA